MRSSPASTSGPRPAGRAPRPEDLLGIRLRADTLTALTAHGLSGFILTTFVLLPMFNKQRKQLATEES